MSNTIIIPSKDGGSFSAYIAMPEKKPAPAIIVAQEIFGVNKGLRDKCDWLAEQGFIAVCPDLFWRIEPGIELTDQSEAEWARAFELFNAFDIDQGIEDLRAVHHVLKGHADCTSKVGCIGYCLGGKLAYLMATRSTVEASVSYYGVGLDALLDEAGSIANPLMLHIAEEDEFVSKDAQEKIKAGLADNPHVTLHSYEGLNHAFTRVGGKHYDAQGAALADERTLAFLHHTLEKALAA
ncbi:MAG: dienelactone hydrolase family protein [Rhodospirillales bacterium]|nr:dienelactone hydrolase family protein [Rhodospirillales bacterium]MCB9997013.1 dienelactone hydrolase family protein [Rhodospirillales bacterium]